MDQKERVTMDESINQSLNGSKERVTMDESINQSLNGSKKRESQWMNESMKRIDQKNL